MINVHTASNNELDAHSINQDASPRSRRTAMTAEYMPTDVFVPTMASTPVDFRITAPRKMATAVNGDRLAVFQSIALN